MKLATEQRHVEKSGVVNEKEFSIKATAKAFAILSSGLYSDKILAIVRELSCNAWDAHVAAGTVDTPFEIKLPTSLDPTFFVKDFGVGLAHDEVMDLYTTYFDSSKSDSDDYIGALGLGSKSPFSYVQTFSVESRYKGVKRLYSAFIGDAGVPSIALLGKEKTTEPNGVTVSLATKSGDSDKFREASQKALMYFAPQPKIFGNRGYKVFSLEHTVSGSNWKVRKADWYAHMKGAYVVQGQVAYPIEREILSQNGLSATAFNILGLDIDFTVPIGKVEVAASREALSYSKPTIKNLIEAIEVASSEMRDVLQKQFDTCKTMWEAQQLHAELRVQGNMKNIFLDLNKTKPFTWKRTAVQHAVVITTKAIKKTRIDLFKMSHYWRSGGDKIKRSQTWDPTSTPTSFSFEMKSRIVVLVDDTRTNSVVYKLYLDDYKKKNKIGQDNTYVLVLKGTKKKEYSQKEVDTLLKRLGNPPVEYISALNLKVPASTTKGGYYKPRKADKALKWTGFTENATGRIRYVFSRLCWSNEKINLLNTKTSQQFYVEIKRFTIFNLDGTEAENFQAHLHACRDIGLVPANVKVYGLNEKQVELAKDNPAWTNVFEFMVEKFAEANDKDILHDRAVIADALELIGTGVANNIIAQWPTLGSKVKKGSFKQTFDVLSLMYEATKHIKYKPATIVSAAQYVNVKDFSDTVGKSRRKLIKSFNEMVEKHAMLRLVNWTNLQIKDVDMIIDYANFIASK